jgi:hypothetical protein
MEEKKNKIALVHSLHLTIKNELIDDNLSPICKVTKLSQLQNEEIGILEKII